VTEGVVAGRRAVIEAIKAGVASEVLVGRGSRRNAGLREVLATASRANVPVREQARAELDALAPAHRGVIARTRGSVAFGERELSTFPFDDDAVVVVLDGVEDPQNLGASARCAEAAGAAMLVTRVHRAAPISEAAIRASAGALAHLPVARVANIARALERLQDTGFTVVGLDGGADRTVLDGPSPEGRLALVVGSEGTGLGRLVRERCDALVALPMRGSVGSLNAAAALAAALYAYVLPSRRPSTGDDVGHG
jgi:23S rRNA (guanosine2251-2'-O)-methyltransferase